MINPAFVIAALLYIIGSDDRSIYYSQRTELPQSLIDQTFNEIMHHYSRDVTVLEVGTPSVDSIYERALQYPRSVFVVLAKGQPEQKLLPANVIWLNRNPNLEDIERLSFSEHFDIVVLNDHRFDDFEKLVSLCQQMSHHFIVNPSSPTVFQTDTPFSLVKRSFVHPRTIKRKFTVYYDYDEKFLVKVRPPYPDQKSAWQPGINLITYLSLNGTHPDRESVASHLPVDDAHLDWMPNNMVIQGDKIVLVDRADPANALEVPGTTRLCRDELTRTKELVLQSQHKAADAVKQLFCKIYKVEGLLHIEESD